MTDRHPAANNATGITAGSAPTRQPRFIGRGFCDIVGYATGWDGQFARRGNAYTPPSNTSEPTALSKELSGLIGHNVALWVTDDEFFAMPTIVQFNDLGKSE
ncbi:hypothetical protein [Arthrobacter sp. ISL-5]|uniref:hypothetical protein n=1 Tax=Arthrobacter sp. ISL-5 TaxID=2819111 RepID=UPI001BEB969B|nr:hypothetical protein [Arthrobacter sp. ISL-5]MBT2551593.1 hypothetical protein [Arthrobacter sp. ISL-5]